MCKVKCQDCSLWASDKVCQYCDHYAYFRDAYRFENDISFFEDVFNNHLSYFEGKCYIAFRHHQQLN